MYYEPAIKTTTTYLGSSSVSSTTAILAADVTGHSGVESSSRNIEINIKKSNLQVIYNNRFLYKVLRFHKNIFRFPQHYLPDNSRALQILTHSKLEAKVCFLYAKNVPKY